MNAERDLIKWWGYIICAVLILAAIVLGIFAVDKLQRRSAVYGSGFGVDWEYADDADFTYSTTAIKFSQDDDSLDGYTAVRELPGHDFDGDNFEYDLSINGVSCLHPETKLGVISGTYTYRFYGAEGDELATATLSVRLVFVAGKTTLTLHTTGADAQSYLSRMFCTEGFNLIVHEI